MAPTGASRDRSGRTLKPGSRWPATPIAGAAPRSRINIRREPCAQYNSEARYPGQTPTPGFLGDAGHRRARAARRLRESAGMLCRAPRRGAAKSRLPAMGADRVGGCGSWSPKRGVVCRSFGLGCCSRSAHGLLFRWCRAPVPSARFRRGLARDVFAAAISGVGHPVRRRSGAAGVEPNCPRSQARRRQPRGGRCGLRSLHRRAVTVSLVSGRGGLFVRASPRASTIQASSTRVRGLARSRRRLSRAGRRSPCRSPESPLRAPACSRRFAADLPRRGTHGLGTLACLRPNPPTAPTPSARTNPGLHIISRAHWRW